MPRQNPIITALQRDLADAIERRRIADHDVTSIKDQLERFGKLVRKKTARPPKPGEVSVAAMNITETGAR